MPRFQRTFAAVIATAALAGSFAVSAQTQASPAVQPAATATAAAAPTAHHHSHRAKSKLDHAQRHAERSERLKTILQIQPNQQAPWDKYVQATSPQPRAQKAERPDLRKLTTPERLDLAQKLRKERNAKAEQREQATRSFYSSLTPSQQKAFDTLTAQRPGKHKAQAAKRHGHSAHHHPVHAHRAATPAM